jgi:hypothetical protein
MDILNKKLANIDSLKNKLDKSRVLSGVTEKK